jgi:hypothetical protein
MKIGAILETIRGLAASQGFYGRLYRNLMEVKKEDPERWSLVCHELESQNFRDPVDMVLYFET